ncbi:MAG TPA: inorganic phosphate transporter [Candidatus Paceibacterota bacterium]|nr:inorganic phosphate transporter [Verrucomicrobiota bacterium]HSA11882.1 inorganic phosphate transporter [Candidatus Paceibacterota bacterium]
MTLLLTVIVVALAFEFINGFHDTANSVAAVVGTRVLTPTQAIMLAAVTNLAGALAGTAVATTVGQGLVDAQCVTGVTLICGLGGAIIWNLITWRLGLPSSSSHALIGGLVGSAVASAGNNWNVVIWSEPVAGKPWYAWGGLLYKVIIPMFSSPILGFLVGFLWMTLLYVLLARCRPSSINKAFRKLQIVSAGFLGFSHGSNDAQKTMGILALALFSATNIGHLNHLPSWLHFLYTPEFRIPLWVKLICAFTMAAGTATGGRRIIKTLGRKVSRLQPVNGFAADSTSASVLMTTAVLGMPVSTTHAVSTSIMGVGAARNYKTMHWHVVESIVWTWFMTLPATGLLAYALMRLFQALGGTA